MKPAKNPHRRIEWIKFMLGNKWANICAVVGPSIAGSIIKILIEGKLEYRWGPQSAIKPWLTLWRFSDPVFFYLLLVSPTILAIGLIVAAVWLFKKQWIEWKKLQSIAWWRQ